MSGSPTQLYIYELSNGLARQMSPLLLGKQIDGIWHTGVVCFGREFFFGGGGIESCPPGGTVLGMPDEVVDLGHTHITEDIFMLYLRGLGMEAFRPEKYHLFEHNCNTFSNEVAMFLTGQKIPRHIHDLPRDVLNSAFGQMIKPFVDSMRVTPAGGSSVSNNLQPSSSSSSSSSFKSNSKTTPPSTLKEDPGNPESIFEPRENFSKDNSSQKPSDQWEPLPPPPVIFDVGDVGDSFKQLKEELTKGGQEGDIGMLDELQHALTNKSASITDEHVRYVESKCQEYLKSKGRCLIFLLEILQALCLNKDFLQLLPVKKFLWTIVKEFSSCSSRSSEVHVAGVNALCNAIRSHAGHALLLTDSPPPHLSSVTACSLLADQPDMMAVGGALTFNIARYKVHEDIALECSTAIIEVLNKGVCGETAYRCLYALQRFMECSPEIPSLVAVMGVDFSKYLGQSDEMDGLCQQLKTLMS